MTKICNRCKIEKSVDDYYLVNHKGKQRLYHICKACHKDRRDPSYQRDWELQKNYGISLEEYNKECQIRGNCCDICDLEKPPLHVDHCHKTGKIRGYLCGACNRGIGLLKDDPQLLYNASIYLKGHNDQALGNSGCTS